MNNLLENDKNWWWKASYWVCGMCLSHFPYYLIGYCVLYGNWAIDRCDEYIICTTNWFIQTSVKFRKCLVNEGDILKNTNLLQKIPWSSRKQWTFSILSNSDLVFLAFLLLSAKTYPLVCVDFVFWKELNKCFWYFLLMSLLFAMLGILSTPLFCWLERTALCVYRECIQTINVLVVEIELVHF